MTCDILPFDDKKVIYATSQYKLSNDIQANSWTPQSIENRQLRLSNIAKEAWRISQFG
ncbi:MAG: hypothetical protein ACI8XB_002803 [Patiriisocius sp.]|jgi:hypothetical protein